MKLSTRIFYVKLKPASNILSFQTYYLITHMYEHHSAIPLRIDWCWILNRFDHSGRGINHSVGERSSSQRESDKCFSHDSEEYDIHDDLSSSLNLILNNFYLLLFISTRTLSSLNSIPFSNWINSILFQRSSLVLTWFMIRLRYFDQ